MGPFRRPTDPSGDPDQLRALGVFKNLNRSDRRPPVTWVSIMLWSGLMVLLFYVLTGGF